MAKDIAGAVREICLSFPEATERVSHGSPDFHIRGKTFASFVVNHHGDGRVALWLAAPPGAQPHYVEAEPEHFFVPPYVGPRGWLGVHLNKGLDWRRVAQHVREAYLAVAPKKLTVDLPPAIVIKPPTQTIAADVLDPLSTQRAKQVLGPLREFCLSLPETSENKAFGWPVWRVGKKTFAGVHRYDRRMTLQFWVGSDMQAMLTFEKRYRVPAYIGHNGWIELDVEDEMDFDEVRELVLVSFRHFAPKRALDGLAAAAAPVAASGATPKASTSSAAKAMSSTRTGTSTRRSTSTTASRSKGSQIEATRPRDPRCKRQTRKSAPRADR